MIIHGSRAWSQGRLHVGKGENHSSSWKPLIDDGCYNPGQRFSDHDLAYGSLHGNWSEGMQVYNIRTHSVLTFNGTEWVSATGIKKFFGILGKEPKRRNHENRN
jgi:hypothetical protein